MGKKKQIKKIHYFDRKVEAAARSILIRLENKGLLSLDDLKAHIIHRRKKTTAENFDRAVKYIEDNKMWDVFTNEETGADYYKVNSAGKEFLMFLQAAL